ncbi:MAG: bL21 family ribosomal protein [Candidatus Berkelbacteria bacterium]|nr:MAG: bL21 family ribosomal protein [Candidatus Berkelbacteria bacterium]QQG51456.1 MAG: bL21 family ribosomal protein [Candidatus Berkelbacteria bacterium]
MTDTLFSVVELGGKQHLVAAGTRITTNRLKAKEGEILELKSLDDSSPVSLKVITHSLGKKINGLKFKNKVRYLKRYGHRQTQTVLEVTAIGGVKKAVAIEEKVAKTAKKASAKAATGAKRTKKEAK